MRTTFITIILLVLLIFTSGCSTTNVTSIISQGNQPPLETKVSIPISISTSTSTQTSTIPTVTTTATASIIPSIVSTPSLASAIAKASPAIVRVITDTGMGSGMIIDTSGYVLTNNHVIEDSQTINVMLNNGQEFPASILGKDEITDLAILKFSDNNLPVVTLGDSSKLEQGDNVIAIGYPLDLKGSATISSGIVSAFRNEGSIDYIQTDTAINPGNSGGALINLEGEVVGINEMTIRTAEGLPIEGMNFAIAINTAKPIIPKLITGMSILNPTTTLTWATYNNVQYGYSIQYPSNWKQVSGNDSPNQYIFSPGSAIIVLSPPTIEQQDTLLSYVDKIIKNRNAKILSRINLMWQGIYQACLWTELPTTTFNNYQINLCILDNGYFYLIIGSLKESEYESYSSAINAILNSFRLNQ